jgi:hypothetical protein
MLLIKQDRISKLEAKLKKLDRLDNENNLGTCRRDGNKKRTAILKQLDEAFSAYGKALPSSEP